MKPPSKQPEAKPEAELSELQQAISSLDRLYSLAYRTSDFEAKRCFNNISKVLMDYPDTRHILDEVLDSFKKEYTTGDGALTRENMMSFQEFYSFLEYHINKKSG